MKILAYQRVETPVLTQLKEQHDVRFFKNIDTNSDPAFLDFLSQADGIIGLDLPVNQTLLNCAPRLKIISNVSVGFNNLPIEELSRRQIMATNTPGVLTDTVADMVMGLIISTARRLPELDRFVKDGNWEESLDSTYYGTDVHHKTLGIIGMGRIGTAIAQRAHAGFHMDIVYHSRTRKPEVEQKFQATYASLDELLAVSDFVCLITPLTNETEYMIGRREFKLMKKSAFFINASRGKTVVEQDLIAALQNNTIAGAGLDVYEQEPIDPSNPLLRMDNVVTLPHIGSSTYETELAMSQLAAENLLAGLSGKRPKNLLNPEVWERK
ncbi:D-glycerate dehydrogenase [Virgibacillus pantothenticus]|uniref:2-hydroxyacid dehydrogenase n=1 Tax=Virgibacillus pantothenticus TaxID=1473 RepID=UPI001C21A5B5|nr:D-glycerate dehydrogenase [Virgibacillus pantothenticus]MBU8567651.1 D-glycerate dehydrogenase [Virgibacillus pantothenticus]MBU8602320.1 D-glycerate dehydrogenase [Virgibacillus pantothenticus]MBU8635678.1 D-glycerate dehydrogenase [Virgibacillus pantothenticus]MBU8644270.1 D-glycerate dehydrogenase [Virgibacillus pantothenticus]MBU8648403.1 D-glycerate dehydrogenase [Virgibacillus pantothenticus]